MVKKATPTPADSAMLVPALSELRPMLLSKSRHAPADEADFLVEIKYDGYRVMAEFEPGRPSTLQTKSGADCTKWFPEIARTLAAGRGRCVVDGEMCVLDDIGRTDFDALHARALRRRFVPGSKPVTFCVFDLLVLDGRNVMGLPLLERKELLRELLQPAPPGVLYVNYFSGDGMVTWLFTKAKELMLEGVVAKRLQSPYRPGTRTPDWVKVKRAGAVPPGRFRRRTGEG